jgi:hypothetical protein
MIWCKFKHPVRTKGIGFPDGDFGLVVQALHDFAGNQFLGPERVEDQLSMRR